MPYATQLFLLCFLFCSAVSMHIVGISSSLRNASCNTGLLRSMAKRVPTEHTMEIIVPGDLPLFNQDLESGTLPSSVQDFRSKCLKADAFVFSLCEYNFGVSAAIKNALDWGSRGPEGNVFDDKPTAVVSAGGGVGGLRADQHFRDIALFLNMQVMNKPALQVHIFNQPMPFDMTTGDLIDEKIAERGGLVMESLIAWSDRLNGNK